MRTTDPRGRSLVQVAEDAVRESSAHGPRLWRLDVDEDEDRIVVRTDRPGQVTPVRPAGRDAVLSGGAALFDVRVALATRGWATEVQRLPRPDDPDLLAEVRPVPGAPDAALAALTPTALRRTASRRRFTGGQSGDDVLRRLIEIAERDGVHLVPVVHESHRRLIARLTRQAEQLKSAVPGAGTRPRSRTNAAQDDGGPMVLLATRTDDRLAWLRSGETLQHMLLELSRLNWVGGPLPRVVEVPVTRMQLRAALTWDAHPQVLVRIAEAAPPRGSERPGAPSDAPS